MDFPCLCCRGKGFSGREVGEDEYKRGNDTPIAELEDWHAQEMANQLGTAASRHTAPPGTQLGPGGSWQDLEVVHCDSQVTQIGKYAVHFQTPTQKRWDETWDDSTAVVLFFHGTDMAYAYQESAFRAKVGSYFEERVQTIKKLLEAGFAVVAPDARWHKTTNGVGHAYWDVNKAKYSQELEDWKTSNDAQLMNELFEMFKGKELHAVGFSSGGYHLSRIGNDLEWSIKLNSISSLGAGYFSPNFEITPSHPPIQFLQGEGDIYSWNEPYYEALQKAGVKTRSITVDCRTGPAKVLLDSVGLSFAHLWIPEARNLVLEWIQSNRRQAQ